MRSTSNFSPVVAPDSDVLFRLTDTGTRSFSYSPGFETIDGQFVSLEAGEAALRNGSAMLVGGLLVGFAATVPGVGEYNFFTLGNAA